MTQLYKLKLRSIGQIFQPRHRRHVKILSLKRLHIYR
jgi:hypothetical protein